MARSFSAQSLIALPQLAAAGMSTLVQQLVTQAAEQKLSGDLHEALGELVAAKTQLDAALGEKPATDTNPAAVLADHAVDVAWGATYDWLSGWSRLAGTKEAATASELLGAVFPDGVGFVKLKFLVEYSESDRRLTLIQKEKLGASFKALGGAPFLAQVQATHAAYGKALGVTEAKKGAPAPASSGVRAALDDVNEALREYVAKVAASVSKKKPKTAEVAASLLDPLARLTADKRAASAASTATSPAPAAASASAATSPTPTTGSGSGSGSTSGS